MTVSIKRLGRGDGLRYLLESVVRGDGAVDLSNPLTRYYAESGTPPGRFLGAGLAYVGGAGGIATGAEVSEEHLYNMLSVVGDPITGQALGARSRTVPSAGAKVAGFDLTFSLPKSISVAWAVADGGTQGVIYQAHQDAIALTLEHAERHVFFSRSGAGGIVQEPVDGVTAAAFDHWDSRAGDPQLHTHLVVQNIARSSRDGQWRTLDSRALYKHVVSLSEMHQGIVQDLLAERMGWQFDARTRRHSSAPKWEVTGVSDEVQAEFSQRSAQLLSETERLVNEFTAATGRTPTPREVLQLRQRATLTTRTEKHHHSLADQTDQWRGRARDHVGADTVAWVNSLAKQDSNGPRLRADDLTPTARDLVASRVVAAVGDAKSTFTRANLVAEAHRQMHGWRFADPVDRLAVAETITDQAERTAVLLTPTEQHHVPTRFRTVDGTSMFMPATSRVFTTAAVLEAEQRLLNAGRTLTAPTVTVATVANIATLPLPGKTYRLSDDQAYAVERIATSGRQIDVLVGPAGTGKTTSMQGLMAVWQAEHGTGSVVALAPSAAAAQVLGDELGIVAENTQKWLHEHDKATTRARKAAQLRAAPGASGRQRAAADALEARVDRWKFKAGQLVIVDEASLAGTFSLDRLTRAANEQGAKVLLVGDWAQLSAVESGGAFSMLVADRDMAPELSDIRRFRNTWEKAASVDLRLGRAAAVETYTQHGRIHSGDRGQCVDQLYQAWETDVAAGKTSLMIAGDHRTVSDLNARARATRVAAGTVELNGHSLVDGTVAGVGDEVITRLNKRTLNIGTTWVKNGDRWHVDAVHADGSLTVRRPNGGSVVLPADYVAEHVDLGYAVTAHRAQGATVDTAHALANATTTREVLYVAATRGREANHIYVDTTYDPDPSTSHGPPTVEDVGQVLSGILERSGSELAALVTSQRLAEERTHLQTLYREFATLAREADTDHWTQLVGAAAGESATARLTASPSWPSLAHTLRDLDGRGLDPTPVLARLASTPGDDPAGVVVAALRQYAVDVDGGPAVPRDRSVVGLLAYPHVSDADLKRGLDERVHAIRERARLLLDRGRAENADWVRGLGTPPAAGPAREAWTRAALTVAAYRELHSYTGPLDRLTVDAAGRTQIGDARAADAAVRQARALAAAHHSQEEPLTGAAPARRPTL